MRDNDIYAVAQAAPGVYYITKKGDFFLHCTGGKADADNIASMLNDDYKRMREEMNKHGKMQEMRCADSVASDS